MKLIPVKISASTKCEKCLALVNLKQISNNHQCHLCNTKLDLRGDWWKPVLTKSCLYNVPAKFQYGTYTDYSEKNNHYLNIGKEAFVCSSCDTEIKFNDYTNDELETFALQQKIPCKKCTNTTSFRKPDDWISETTLAIKYIVNEEYTGKLATPITVNGFNCNACGGKVAIDTANEKKGNCTYCGTTNFMSGEVYNTLYNNFAAFQPRVITLLVSDIFLRTHKNELPIDVELPDEIKNYLMPTDEFWKLISLCVKANTERTDLEYRSSYIENHIECLEIFLKRKAMIERIGFKNKMKELTEKFMQNENKFSSFKQKYPEATNEDFAAAVQVSIFMGNKTAEDEKIKNHSGNLKIKKWLLV